MKRPGSVCLMQCFSLVASFSGCVGAQMPKWFCPFSVVPTMVKDSIFSTLMVVGRAMGVSQRNPVFSVMYISVWNSVFLSIGWTCLGQSRVAGCKHSMVDPENGEHFTVCPSSQFCSKVYWIHLRMSENLSEDPLGWGVGSEVWTLMQLRKKDRKKRAS